jgi:hypothetical protein
MEPYSPLAASDPARTTVERAAIAAEGYDPDAPAVIAALVRVSAALAELGFGAENARRLAIWQASASVGYER